MVEVMVALGLIAVALMLVLGLIPVGVQSSQRAADIQAAAAWSRQLIEDTPPPKDLPIPSDLASKEFKQQIGSTKFTAVRTVKVTGPYLYRIEVETTWRGASHPVKLSLTRYNPAGPQS
jgi:uncharacterized protein (TIGR02598 family)